MSVQNNEQSRYSDEHHVSIQVLAVRNHHGTWSAPKGHLRIKDNGQLEIPLEASPRELFEETSIRLKRSKRTKQITANNYQQLISLKMIIYLECNLDLERASNDGNRRIGLYLCHIDDRRLKFRLKDMKENQVN